MHVRSRRLAATLVPDAPGLRLEQLDTTDTTITVSLTSTTPTAHCPQCSQPAWRVRSRYQRTLADLPWSGLTVKLLLSVRKFACDFATCRQRIFTERLPTVTLPYARRTNRIVDVLRLIAFAMGGEGGSRLLARLRMSASAPTLLRLIRCTPLPPQPTPRVLGIDDWARRKGQTYGTILVDVERHQPIDLLPDRTAQSVTAWLHAHPGVEIISRDRAGAYAEGATNGAPNAIQVADRWHLLGNLSDALERALQQHRSLITQSLRPQPVVLPIVPADVASSRPTSQAQVLSKERRVARLERYTLVHTLHEQGLSQRNIADRLGMNKKTVQRFISTEVFPERRARPPRHSRLDPYKPYLLERWNAGCHNGAQLWHELTARGYGGGRSILREFLAGLRTQQSMRSTTEETVTAIDVEPKPPTVRQLIWCVMRRPEKLTEGEQRAVARLRAVHPDVTQAVQFTQEFAAMVRHRQAEKLEAWLWRVANSDIPALRSFAAGIQRDKAAVLAGLSLEWSQGQVEGQITRLKLLKRAMYGRANMDLLRQRVLHAA